MGGSLLALAAALVVDRLVGDPGWLWTRLPHPIVLIGAAIERLERHFNKLDLSFSARRARGIAALVLLIFGGACCAVLLQFGARMLPFGIAVETLVLAVFLAQKSLVDHVGRVAEALGSEGVAAGRRAVAMIVGRDTSVLDEGGIARAAIESAAENFSDGLVAPVFWYALLGLPGVLVFKIVNTADSMIGHRSPRFEAFGWAAARLDDAMNLVPARLSALLIAMAASGRGGTTWRAAEAAWRDARLHRSPNAGWPEAAAAGALGLALGGPRRYGDVVLEGAWLNRQGSREAGPEDIEGVIRLVDTAWALLLVAVVLIAFWTAR
jgi:adenosylcobinamide-phosphate synthase